MDWSSGTNVLLLPTWLNVVIKNSSVTLVITTIWDSPIMSVDGETYLWEIAVFHLRIRGSNFCLEGGGIQMNTNHYGSCVTLWQWLNACVFEQSRRVLFNTAVCSGKTKSQRCWEKEWMLRPVQWGKAIVLAREWSWPTLPPHKGNLCGFSRLWRVTVVWYCTWNCSASISRKQSWWDVNN